MMLTTQYGLFMQSGPLNSFSSLLMNNHHFSSDIKDIWARTPIFIKHHAQNLPRFIKLFIRKLSHDKLCCKECDGFERWLCILTFFPKQTKLSYARILLLIYHLPHGNTTRSIREKTNQHQTRITFNPSKF